MADWKLKIIKREVIDEDPDLSYLGEYSDEPFSPRKMAEKAGMQGPAGWVYQDAAWVIDRGPFMERGEYKYFVATDTLGKLNPKTGKPWAESTKRKYARQQYERMERYRDNDWSMAGLYVEAIVTNDQDERLFSTRTHGLWNVENDSGSEYYESIWAEEMVEITELLAEINEVKLTPEQIADAIKYAEEV